MSADCLSCGERFGGVRLFDRHRVGPVGERRCLTSEAMAARGWHRDARGLWRDGRRTTMPLRGATSDGKGAKSAAPHRDAAA